jgi:hypothetical protein
VTHQRLEPFGLGLQDRAAERRQPVVPAALVVFLGRRAPIGLVDERERFEPREGGVERAGAEAQGATCPLGDVADDPVSVQVAAGERQQDVELLRAQRQEASRVVDECILHQCIELRRS